MQQQKRWYPIASMLLHYSCVPTRAWVDGKTRAFRNAVRELAIVTWIVVCRVHRDNWHIGWSQLWHRYLARQKTKVDQRVTLAKCTLASFGWYIADTNSIPRTSHEERWEDCRSGQWHWRWVESWLCIAHRSPVTPFTYIHMPTITFVRGHLTYPTTVTRTVFILYFNCN